VDDDDVDDDDAPIASIGRRSNGNANANGNGNVNSTKPEAARRVRKPASKAAPPEVRSQRHPMTWRAIYASPQRDIAPPRHRHGFFLLNDIL